MYSTPIYTYKSTLDRIYQLGCTIYKHTMLNIYLMYEL